MHLGKESIVEKAGSAQVLQYPRKACSQALVILEPEAATGKEDQHSD